MRLWVLRAKRVHCCGVNELRLQALLVASVGVVHCALRLVMMTMGEVNAHRAGATTTTMTTAVAAVSY